MNSFAESDTSFTEFDPILQIPQVEMDAFTSQFELAADQGVPTFDLPLEQLNDNIDISNSNSNGEDLLIHAPSLPDDGDELPPEFRQVEDAVSVNINADKFIAEFATQEENQVPDLYSQYILPDAATDVQGIAAQLVTFEMPPESEQGEKVDEPPLQLESTNSLPYNLPLFAEEEHSGLPSLNPPAISQGEISQYGTSLPTNYPLINIGENPMNLVYSGLPMQKSAGFKRGLSFTTSTRASPPPEKKMHFPAFSHVFTDEDLGIAEGHQTAIFLPHMNGVNSEVSYMTAATIDTIDTETTAEKPAARFVKRRRTHERDPQKFQCTLCPKKYKRRYDCNIHVEEKHLRILKYQCAGCGYTCPRKFSYTRHKKTCKADPAQNPPNITY